MRYIVYYTIVIALIPRYTVSYYKHDCADGELRMGFALGVLSYTCCGLRDDDISSPPASQMIIEKTLPSPPPQHPVTKAKAEVPPPPYTPDTYREVPPSFSAPEPDIHSVNHLHIHNRHQDVIGTYCVDPVMPVPHKFKGKSKWQASSKTPNASFRTRHHASISINLATRSTTSIENKKAYVRATTRKGDININLYSLQRGIHMNLDVSSRRGRIFVLIPRNFCGAIQLKSRKGGYNVLPALSSASRVLTAKDREALILVGDPNSVPSSSGITDDSTTDFCQLGSASGKVIIGFTGEDKYVPTETGLWEKLGEFLQRLK